MKSIRPTDYVLTAVLAALAVGIGFENVNATNVTAPNGLAHTLSSQTPMMIPVFVAAVLPILWRRSAVLPALAVTFGVIAVSLPAFGWVTRCGFGLPLMAAYAYAVARFGGSWLRQVIGMLGVVATLVLILIRDSSTGGFENGSEAFWIGLGLAAAGYLAGTVVNAARRSRATQVGAPKLEHAH